MSLVSQAVAELHLGRTEEAEAALDQATKKDASYAEAIANMLVLAVISGKDPKEHMEYVCHLTHVFYAVYLYSMHGTRLIYVPVGLCRKLLPSTNS